ncbi:hypothetical protein JHK85_018580 [Glycine max]|nr:hypothetical protein JHK85_018580 [Glycine max]KAG5037343.1 hypothetical protein JHK86_018183 [Glycine max]
MIRRGLAPDVWCYTFLINGVCKSERIDEAVNLFKDMHLKNLVPDTITYISLVDALCRSGRISYAWKLVNEMHDNAPPLDGEVDCKRCDGHIEDTNHILLGCCKSWELWSRVLDWWGFSAPLHSDIRNSSFHSLIFTGIVIGNDEVVGKNSNDVLGME